MKARILIWWLIISGFSFISRFLVTTLLTTIFPSEAFFASWVGLIRVVTGARTVAEYPTHIEAFLVVLELNTLAVLAVSLAGAILMSSILLPVYGAFYGLALFGGGLKLPEACSLALFFFESLFLVLTAAFSSFFGSCFFGFCSPNPRTLLRFWLDSVHRTPKPIVSCLALVRMHREKILLSTLTILMLMILAGWYEIWIAT